MEHLYNYNLTSNPEDLDHALCNLAFMVEFDEMDRNRVVDNGKDGK